MADNSEVRDDLKYTVNDEWAKAEGENVRVGITDHAQHQLTDIVFVELPKVGMKVRQGDVIGQVESVKTVAAINAPVSGEIVEVNEELEDAPQRFNESPYEDGWLAVIRMEDPSEYEGLLDAAGYREKLSE
ncbi:MAG TPA: glycine cleavage system protein GcvH [Methanomassiliicoccaceae archaeon]|jgi:glycine cleavage system H protein|nr:glycine cleavage system protein GcvH [Euryarchaeota archaeon]HOB38605.1 glycine cleavage system protein GcvH [Methanomassiliicoccaceae archaeon]HOL06753.1 glycine cleavage system protein GcvH [Methanomassiliicoccaceae archaeon]HOQ26593.1 glycine cleavage system protein GcvH [Methanomassiliicoccaceae archaeon]HPT73358.1 glycine cleavage system protein GcvH [Methanomassiliicoccaceae archaeon]